jgi:hypothetical protein
MLVYGICSNLHDFYEGESLVTSGVRSLMKGIICELEGLGFLWGALLEILIFAITKFYLDFPDFLDK